MQPELWDDDLVRAASEHWLAAAERFRLSPRATAVGEVLLRAELDPDERERVAPGEPANTCVRRAHIVYATRNWTARDAALGLSELETRGVVEVHGREWLSAEVRFVDRVRSHCIVGPDDPASSVYEPIASRIESAIERVVARCRERETNYFTVIRGASGSGRDSIAEYFASLLGHRLLTRSATELRDGVDPLEPELSGCIPLWDGRGGEHTREDLRRAAGWLARSPSVALAITDDRAEAPRVHGRHELVIEASPANARERVEAWSGAARRVGVPESVARFAAERIGTRSTAGAGLAWRVTSRTPRADGADAADYASQLEGALYELTGPGNASGIVLEPTPVKLDDVVVSEPIRAGLDRLVALARAPGQSMSGRVGTKALFGGASGTGKTMAARAIARQLGVPLFRVDLATMVSKWVGETEKNLRAAFGAASASGAALLFDEGDALFAKRGEVQRGSDRYANLEVSYLLQAVELHEGLVIVTTNLHSNIDGAFMRRFDVVVSFPQPTRVERAELWWRELGTDGPDTLHDFITNELAGVEITGGNIASAARLARALAHDRGDSRVSERDLCRAVASELEKVGAGVQASEWHRRADGAILRSEG